MLVGISDEKRVLPPDKCRSPVGGHEKGLSPSWISYPLMQFLDAPLKVDQKIMSESKSAPSNFVGPTPSLISRGRC